jgi:hypothetical protein
MQLKPRKLSQINNETADIINLFAVRGKKRLIGSAGLRAIHYASDYDVETILSGITPSSIKKMFQDAYRKIGDDVWVTDFKCGYDERLIYNGEYDDKSLKKYLKNPLITAKQRRDILKATGEDRIEKVRDLYILRWSHQDVIKGEKTLCDGTVKKMEDAMMDKTTMKIDLIVQVGNQYCEISENYYIKVGNNSNYTKMPTKKELETDLEEDIQYYSKIDSFKSLKRLFSLLQVEGAKKNKAKLDKLVAFFNGQVGYLNKIKNELGILEVLLEQPRKPKWEDVEANLQFIKEQISSVYQVPLTEQLFVDIDKITKQSALKDVLTLKDYFQKKINAESKEFLRTQI